MATGKIRFPEWPFPDKLDSFDKVQEFSELMYTALVEDGLARTEDLNTTDINTIGNITMVNLVVGGTTTINTVAYTWPSSDGNADEVLTTDGSGTWSFKDITGISGYSAGTTTFVSLTDTPANYTGDAKKLLFVNAAGNAVAFATNTLWDETNESLGIGSIAPAGRLTLVSSTFPVARIYRTSNATNTGLATLDVVHKTSGDMANGLGVSIAFTIEDATSGLEPIASVGAVRSGADDTGSLILRTYLTGSSSERVRINEEGLIVGGASDVTCGGTGCIILQNLNAPNASPSNAPVLFSNPKASGSGIYCLNIRNSDGTVLKLQQCNYIADASGGGGNVDTVVNAILDILQANGLMASS